MFQNGKGLKILFLSLFLLGFIPSGVLAFNPPSVHDIPKAIQINGKTVSLKDIENPLPHTDANIQKGSKVYYENCFLCHGDLLGGRGVLAERFFPAPTNFRRPNSIISKPKAYAYWRIMKGGRDLPEQYEPWNSAMPAWEHQLTDEEVWQVILFLFQTLTENPSASTPSQPSAERGRQVYLKNCAQCHGKEADGKGIAAPFMNPPPRNLTKGQFKLRSTPFGKIPTDNDFMASLNRGLPNTAMPGWSHLPEVDRLSLMAYIKSISRKFQRFIQKKKAHKIIQVPKPAAFNLESLRRGKELFLINCSGCHGVKGRSDGTSTERIVDIPTGAIWPRNLTKPWTFRRGARREDLYMTLRTGLYGSAMPMFSTRTMSDQQIWDIVHYVQSLGLSKKPPVKRLLKVSKVEGELPMNPDDPKWKPVATWLIPLGGQIISEKKLYFTIVDSINLQGIHNGNEIAFKMIWDDPKVDPLLIGNIPVKESPLPPIPKNFKGAIPQADEDEEEELEPQEFPDAIALQFPVKNSGPTKPYFLNGGAENSVNLWKWESTYPFRVQELNAIGMQHISPQTGASQEVSGQAIFEYGQYRLVMKRSLTTSDTDGDVQLIKGDKVGIAFNVWDGSSGETGTKMAISSWFNLVLE